MTTTEVQKATARELATAATGLFAGDFQRVLTQITLIRQVISALMKPGVHYGVVPGTEKKDKDGKDISKPSLFQPGSDLLCLLFRLRPEYDTKIVESEDFIGVTSTCKLVHIVTGEVWGAGMGSANSREARYRNQSTGKICPQCKKVGTIFRSKNQGEGYYCWRQKDGCGAQFKQGDAAIESQAGQVITEKLYDLHNTILKISNKRSRTAAVLSATAASDSFTQDLEDMLDEMDEAAAAAKDDSQQPGTPRNGNGGNGGDGKKKATPLQVRDLNMALNDAEIGVYDANLKDLRGREREDFILVRRLEWCSGMLKREVRVMQELLGDEADLLIKAAKAGEVPSTPPATQPAGGKA